MGQEPVQFGPVHSLGAEAFGQPGERTFRLLVQTANGWASLWAEKYQLQALALAIEQLLVQTPDLGGNHDQGYEHSTPLGSPTHDLKVGRIALGLVEEPPMFALVVHDSETDPDGPASMVCLADRGQFQGLKQKIVEVCAAGRPLCPLCGDSINRSGHHCVRLN